MSRPFRPWEVDLLPPVPAGRRVRQKAAWDAKHRAHQIANRLCTRCSKPLPEGWTKLECGGHGNNLLNRKRGGKFS
jgi:hypothetical protein